MAEDDAQLCRLGRNHSFTINVYLLLRTWAIWVQIHNTCTFLFQEHVRLLITWTNGTGRRSCGVSHLISTLPGAAESCSRSRVIVLNLAVKMESRSAVKMLLQRLSPFLVLPLCHMTNWWSPLAIELSFHLISCGLSHAQPR
jgi:hypothetical protein